MTAPLTWTLRPATPDDLEDLVELRAVVMRPDLERLGRYDEHRVRQRLRDGFEPEHTQIIEVEGELAGSITVRPATAQPDPAVDEPLGAEPVGGQPGGGQPRREEPGAGQPGGEEPRGEESSAGQPSGQQVVGERWLEHFYLEPRHQGRGLGTAVLGAVLADADADHATVRLNVLQGSPARKLYERHGFVVESEDPVDIFMIRKFL